MVYFSQIECIFKNTFRKCQCSKEEYLYNGSCNPGVSYVLVLDIETHNDPVTYFTANISSLKQESLQCEIHQQKITLFPQEFVLLTNASLYHVYAHKIYNFQNYCFENIINENNVISWSASICVDKPVVPVCSDDVDKGNNKIGAKSFTFDYLTIKTPLFFDFQRNIKYKPSSLFYHKPTCQNNQVLLKSRLGLNSTLEFYPIAGDISLNVPTQEIRTVFSSKDFCIESNSKNGITTFDGYFCHEQITDKRKSKSIENHISKCCNPNYIFNTINNYCIKDDDSISTFQNFSNSSIESASNMKIGFPKCDYYNISQEKFQLFKKGKLLTDTTTLDPSRYCIDYQVGELNTESEFIGFVCFPDTNVLHDYKHRLTPVLLAVSCVFIFLTLVMYLSLPEFRNKVSGCCLISQLASLLFTYLIFIVLQFYKSNLSETSCVILGVTAHITTLCSFFWLNVLCYDIWKTLKSLKPIAEIEHQNWKVFFKYCIYAWGTPVLVGVITVIIDQGVINVPVRPHIKDQCFISSSDVPAQWMYLYGPILLLLFINFSWMIHIVIIMYNTYNQTKSLVRNRSLKEKYLQCVKLLFVMGITWFAEVLSWRIETIQQQSSIYWAVTDAFNALRGVFIFIIFVCKASVLRKVGERISGTEHRRQTTTTITTRLPASSRPSSRASLKCLSIRSVKWSKTQDNCTTSYYNNSYSDDNHS